MTLNYFYSQSSIFWENLWLKLHGGLHVSSDLHLTLHECILSLQLSLGELHEISIEHNECSVSFNLRFSFDNCTVSVFQVNGESSWGSSLLLSKLESIYLSDLL